VDVIIFSSSISISGNRRQRVQAYTPWLWCTSKFRTRTKGLYHVHKDSGEPYQKTETGLHQAKACPEHSLLLKASRDRWWEVYAGHFITAACIRKDHRLVCRGIQHHTYQACEHTCSNHQEDHHITPTCSSVHRWATSSQTKTTPVWTKVDTHSIGSTSANIQRAMWICQQVIA